MNLDLVVEALRKTDCHMLEASWTVCSLDQCWRPCLRCTALYELKQSDFQWVKDWKPRKGYKKHPATTEVTDESKRTD